MVPRATVLFSTEGVDLGTTGRDGAFSDAVRASSTCQLSFAIPTLGGAQGLTHR